MTMVRTVLLLASVALAAPPGAAGFICHYPVQRLTGFAELNDRFIKLDLDVQLVGPDCEILVGGGTVRCAPARPRTFGLFFDRPELGHCPARHGTIRGGFYVPRDRQRIADVVIETTLANGDTCTIAGTSPTAIIGGPIPSLLGTILCRSPGGEPVGEGSVELLRRPLPPRAP